jgi:hypothetical protein
MSIDYNYINYLIHPKIFIRCRAIVRILNAEYHTQGCEVGHVNAIYPVSRFITHLVYVRGATVHVDVAHITVRFLLVRMLLPHVHICRVSA